MKILIADDDPVARKILSIYLRQAGYDVVFAENGLEALEKIAGEDIGLIIVDINMPYMDGFELLNNLKEQPQLKDIPVVFVTNELDDKEKQKALENGAMAYLTKPLTEEMLVETIKEIINGKINNWR